MSISTLQELKGMTEQLKEMLKASAGAGREAQAEASVPAGTTASKTDEPSGDVEVHNDDVIMDAADEAKAVDPLLEKAERDAAADLVKATVHFDRKAWLEELKLHCFAGSKVIAVVDSCTSKLKHVIEQMTFMADTVKNLMQPESVNILVPVGKRLDLLSSVSQKAEMLFPKQKVFVVASCASDSCLSCNCALTNKTGHPGHDNRTYKVTRFG